MCFIVVFLLGCSLYLLLGRTYTTLKAFGLYFKGSSSSFNLATPYSFWDYQNFPLNNYHSKPTNYPQVLGLRAHYTNLVGHLGMKINASKIISTHHRSPIKNSLWHNYCVMAQTFVSHSYFQSHTRSVYGFLGNHWNF